MPAISVSVTGQACNGPTSGSGELHFQFSSTILGGTWSATISGDGLTNQTITVSAVNGDGSGVFTGVYDGLYTITVTHSNGQSGSRTLITVACEETDCSAFQWGNPDTYPII